MKIFISFIAIFIAIISVLMIELRNFSHNHYILYNVTYYDDGHANINITINTNDNQKTEIYLPTNYGPAQELEKNIKNLKLDGDFINYTKNNELLHVTHKKNTQIFLNYDYVFHGDITKQDSHYPFFTKDYAYFIGHTVIPYVKSEQEVVNFNFKCPDKQGYIITSHGDNNSSRNGISIDNVLGAFYFCGVPDFYTSQKTT